MNLPWCNRIDRSHLWLDVSIECLSHGLAVMTWEKVILTLNILRSHHQVIHHFVLLGLWWGQNSAALPHDHMRIDILLADLIGLEQGWCLLEICRIRIHFHLFIFSSALRLRLNAENFVNVPGGHPEYLLVCDHLLFLSMMLKHWIKQSVHALRGF